MMEVDQPVVSQADKEVMPGETAKAVKPESSVASPDQIVQESDDLPALVISDSEGDEAPAAEAEKNKVTQSRQNDAVDISGVTPLDSSVIDVDAKDEDASELEDAGKDPPKPEEEEEVPKPTENTIAESEQNKKPSNVYENIDLTGSSSADDSGVSDEGCEIAVKKVRKNVAKVVKDTSKLTAQELLQSLLGLQEESSDEEAPVDGKSGVESQPDQEKEVSTPSERDPVGPREQAENVAKRDKRAEEPESLRPPVSSTTAIVEDTVCAEATIEFVTVTQAVGKDQAMKKPNPSDSQTSRSTENSKNADDDDDDDVVCLLEELDDPSGFNKNMEDEPVDGSISSSADGDSSPAVGCEGLSKENENESTIKAVLVESKECEVDSIEEPPHKRPRSDCHPVDEGVPVEPLENGDNFEIGSIASSQNSNDNHDFNIVGSEEKNSKSRKAEKSPQAESQSTVRSRPSSSIGDPMERGESLNTADAVVNAQDSAQTRPEEIPSQYSDVLVIDDDDDDDDDEEEVKDASAKPADKISSMDVEARGKRPRDVDEPDAMEQSQPEDVSSATSSTSAPPVQDSGVKRPKSMEPEESKPLHMEFMKAMSKPIRSMSRDELEEIVLQKICQAMKYQSELVEERKRGDKIVKSMQSLRQRVTDLSKQYSDLKVVHDRVVLDLRRKANRFVQPVRITRAVGLQVNQPPQLSFQTMRASMESSTNGAVNRSAAQSVIPADGNGSPEREGPSGSGTAGTTRDQTTNSAQGTTVVERVVDGFVGGQHPAPNVIRTSRPMNVTFVHGATASAVTIKPTELSRNNGPNVEGGPRGGSSSPSGSSSSSYTGSSWSYKSATGGTPNGKGIGSPSTGPVTARKKTVHKITPKRPPLSAVQQEEQDKMARQQQELFLQDMYNQQARMAKITANSKRENSPAEASQNIADFGQKTAAGTTGIQIRTAMVPSQASVAPPVSTVSNMRADNRMAPSVTNSMTLAGGKQTTTAVTTTPQQSHPAPAAHNSLIDLTDEEESPRVSSGGGAARNRQPDQNGTPPQRNTPTNTNSSNPPELVASNQMVKLSLVARQQNKHKMPQRILNGHVMQRPPATNATAAANSSGTKFGSLHNTSVQIFRPILSKRPPGQALASGMSSLTNGQARHAGPLLPLYPAGAGQRPPTKLPNHPAPLPLPEKHNSLPQWKKAPPKPAIRINNVPTGIVISWSMPDLSALYADIEKYQIYAYQETTEIQLTDAWRHVGDVNALPLPMAVTLTHFNEGQRYHFAVRAIDQHKRSGFFSEPRTW